MGFPVWYTCIYLSQFFKIQQHNHIRTSCVAIKLAAGNLRALLCIASQSLQLSQEEGAGDWTWHTWSPPGEDLAPLL